MTTGSAKGAGSAATLPIPADDWRLVSDSVMGGVSVGEMRTEENGGGTAWCLSGEVSTANNGGFLQLALDIGPETAARAADHEGVSLWVRGNGERYNLHLRSSDLWLPWQSYRSSFATTSEWTTVRLPFSGFEPYKTGAALRPEKLKRIGVVAIGRDFSAEVCVRGLAFYR